jgi:hypothetical protein
MKELKLHVSMKISKTVHLDVKCMYLSKKTIILMENSCEIQFQQPYLNLSREIPSSIKVGQRIGVHVSMEIIKTRNFELK